MPTTINPRMALWALLGIALFLNYQMWSHDYPEVPAAASAGASTAPATPLDSTVPTATAPAGTPAIRHCPGRSPAAGAPGTASADSAHGLVAHALVADSPTAPSVHVVTDVLDVEVSLAGGELRRVDLLAYPQAKNRPDIPVRLLSRDSADSLFVLQSGLAPVNDEFAPTHLALYSSDTRELRLAAGAGRAQAAADLERWAWRDRHQDADLPARRNMRSAWTIRSTTRPPRPGASHRTRRSCATTPRSSARISAPTATRSRARRSTTAPSSRSSTSRRTRSSISRSAAAGWQRCSMISWPLSCRRRSAPIDTSCRPRAMNSCSRPRGPPRWWRRAATATHA